MQPPNEFRDRSGLGNWLNKLLRFCKESQIVDGIGYRLIRTTHGTSLEIAGNRGGVGSSIRQLRLVSTQNDFYSCVEWDGTTAGTEEIYVARVQEHRVSEFNGRTVAYSQDGDSFSATYAYTSATKRTKTISGTAETQRIVPYLKDGFTIIYAIEIGFPITAGASNTPITDPNGDPITLLDLNVDGRAWAKV